MNNSTSYKQATSIYRNLSETTPTRNRKVKIAAIKRALENIEGHVPGVKCVSDRKTLPPLPRLVLTYTRITHLTGADLIVLDDLQKYLDGTLSDEDT